MKTRRFARATLTVVISVLILLSATVPAFAQGVVMKGEPDGQYKSTVMEEHFYSGSLEPNFTSDNVSVKTDSYAMHFGGAYHYGSALVLTAYKLKSYNRFTFSLDILQTNDSFIYCGFGGADPRTVVGNYDANICMTSAITALYEMGGMDQWKTVGNGYQLNSAFANGKTTDLAITAERVSGKSYRMTFEILENGEPIASTDYGALIDLDHADGYFCMWGGLNEIFNIRNFKVYDSPTHLAFSDNFENSSLTYADEAIGDSNWHINVNNFTSDEIFICRNAGPEFTKAGDAITAKNPLVSSGKVSKPYEISVEAKIKSLDKNATFGLFFGAESAGDLDHATVIGVSAVDDKFATVNFIKNGKKADYGDTKIPLSVLNIDDIPVDFNVVIHGDHSLTFTAGGIQFTFNNVNYDGYWGICNYSSGSKSANNVKLNVVTLVNNSYTPCAESDLSNNFAGIKLTPDGFEEYYISDRTYYIGPGVSLRPKGAFTTDPSLYFEGVGGYTGFGPKKPYTDFILQFDVKVVSSGTNGQWFGVAFGKNAYAALGANSTCVNFAYNGWTDTPYSTLNANNCTFTDGTKEMRLDDYHFFKDQDTKYNIMIVAKNRTVYVYFKEDSEDISKLGICRAIIPDVNTAGFVSIFGEGGISFDIFNYRLTNISAEAKGDSEIALRESFEKDQISDKLVIDGAAQVNDGALQLSGGSVSMKNKGFYYIANFTVLDIQDDLTVGFADNKSLVLSKDLKRVTVNDSGKKKVFDVSSYNLPDYKNTQFQLILQYDALSLAAKGIYEPADMLSKPIVEYTFAKPLAAGNLKWSSDNAVIDDIAVYALDDSYTAASVSFEQDPNDGDLWVSKLGAKTDNSVADTDKDSGLPVWLIIGYAVFGAIVLVLLIVIIILGFKTPRIVHLVRWNSGKTANENDAASDPAEKRGNKQ